MTVPLGSVQPVFALPLLEDIPDTDEDAPVEGLSLVHLAPDLIFMLLTSPQTEIGPLALPEIVFGAATFSGQYNSEATIASDVPVRTVRLALRYAARPQPGIAS